MAWTRVDAGKSGVSSISLTVAIALPFMGLSIEAQAQTVTIDTAVVIPTTVNAGETLIVEDSGSIIVPAADAVVGSGAGARTIVNSGTITSTGNLLSGTAISFEAGGASLTLTNSGSITSLNDIGVDVLTLTDLNNSGTITAARAAIDAGTIGNLTNSGTVTGHLGIQVDTDIGSLVNSGAITGTGGHGISSFTAGGALGSLVNSGTITGDTLFDGINFRGTISSLTNSGTIMGGADGVFARDAIDILTNSGTIEGGTFGIAGNTTNTFLNIDTLINSGTIFGGLAGVDLSGGTVGTLINSGAITGNGVGGVGDGVKANEITSMINSGTITGDDYGVRVIATLFSLTNSGTITGGTRAIYEQDGLNTGDTLLTLLEGSVIVGEIYLGQGTNTLVVGNGLSLATTIDANTPLDGVSTSGGNPFATQVDVNDPDRTLVAVVDPTAFSLPVEGLADLTSGIFGVLAGRQSQVGLQSGFSGGASMTLGYAPAENQPENSHVRERMSHVWGEMFGSYRMQDGSGNDTDTTSGVGGLMAGIDGAYFDTLTLGGFVGASWGASETTNGRQETETSSFYAGIYGSSVHTGVTFDFALVGGGSQYDRERQVANNLVANGLETARADYSGWFLSPELTARATLFQDFEPFVTLRYAGLFMDGFTETGTAAPLTLDSQTLHLATARLGVTLPYDWAHADGSQTSLSLTGGVEARRQFGSTTQRGVLLGQSIAFEAGGDGDDALGGFVGLDAEHQISAATTLYANAEAMLETGNAIQLSARAGFRVAF
ncbi:MAG: hypothetical protein Rhims3KO_17050 [Hyphomicrobiales bacterium]